MNSKVQHPNFLRGSVQKQEIGRKGESAESGHGELRIRNTYTFFKYTAMGQKIPVLGAA